MFVDHLLFPVRIWKCCRLHLSPTFAFPTSVLNVQKREAVSAKARCHHSDGEETVSSAQLAILLILPNGLVHAKRFVKNGMFTCRLVSAFVLGRPSFLFVAFISAPVSSHSVLYMAAK